MSPSTLPRGLNKLGRLMKSRSAYPPSLQAGASLIYAMEASNMAKQLQAVRNILWHPSLSSHKPNTRANGPPTDRRSLEPRRAEPATQGQDPRRQGQDRGLQRTQGGHADLGADRGAARPREDGQTEAFIKDRDGASLTEALYRDADRVLHPCERYVPEARRM